MKNNAKKQPRRVISAILTIIMIISMIPFATISVSAYTNPVNVDATTIKSRFDTIISKLNGKYFTVNQKYCNAAPGIAGHGCDNCENAKVFQTSWLKSLLMVPDSANNIPKHYRPSGIIYAPACSCAGFAGYVAWYLYAGKASDNIIGVSEGTVQLSYANLVSCGAKMGDVIGTSGGHSVVLYSYNSSGLTYIQCNGTRIQDGNCKVTFMSNISYSEFAGAFGGTVSLTGCDNYTSSHTHNYVTEYEAIHPHKQYTKCYGCGDYSYTGETRTVSTCEQCNQPKITFDNSKVEVTQNNTISISAILSGVLSTPNTLIADGEAYDFCSIITSKVGNKINIEITAEEMGYGDYTLELIDKNNNTIVKDSITVYSFNDEGFIFTEDENSACFSKCISTYSGTLSIPSVFNGKPVKSLGGNCCFANTNITEVITPNTLEIINVRAFIGCKNLRKVALNNGLKSIGSMCFYDCKSLSEITIPKSVTEISNNTIPQTITIIGYPGSCAEDYANEFGNPFVAIHEHTFSEWHIRSNATCVSSGSKYRVCTECGETATASIPALGHNFSSSWTVDIEATYSKAGSKSHHCMRSGCSAKKDVTVIPMLTNPEAENTSDLTFTLNDDGKSYYVSDCDYEASGAIVIPATYNGKPVTGIGVCAFQLITGLTSITISKSIISIASNAFNACKNLTQINVDANNNYFTSVNGVLFSKDKTELLYYPEGKQGSYTIPNSVTNIGSYAFKGNKKITSVTIPNSVTDIGYCAFDGCESLTSITIPDSVESIGAWAFDNCFNLSSLKIGNGITVIEDHTFYACKSLTSLTIPYGVERIDDNAFSECINLTSLKISNSVTSIGECVFFRCNSLTSITIPNSVTSIGWGAFIDCKNLKSVIIPSSVKEIQEKAFGYYYGEKWVTMKVSGFTIHGAKDTEAEKYAKDNGFTFRNTAVALPAAPKISSVKNTSAGVTVTWGKVSSATGYRVYRKASSEKSWTKIATITKNTTVSYTDKTAKSGTTYTYTVRGYNSAGAGAYNKTGLSIKRLAQPKVTVVNAAKAVTVKWGKITGATGYIVYRKAGSAKSWTKLATITKNGTTSYTDKNVKSGTNYKYTVKAYYGKTYSSYVSGVAIKFLSAPKLSSAVSVRSGITVKWAKVTGATGYYVYRKAGKGGWSKIATLNGNSQIVYTDCTAKKGTTYTYTVRAYNGKYMSTYYSGVSCKDKY